MSEPETGTIVVNEQDAADHLEDLISTVLAGQRVQIDRDGVALVSLVPFRVAQVSSSSEGQSP
jgi:antitoxin (DNA-binding transcriptional repressor) of toxin-antitoxin stability system